MDFSISDQFKPTLDRMRGFMDEHVLPAEDEVLFKGWVEAADRLDGLRAKVKAAGMWGPQIPRDIGGMGLSLLHHGMVSEILGRSPLGHYVFGCQAPDAGNIEILYKYGTPEQKDRFLQPLAEGKIRSCFSMTERDTPGSNPTELGCLAVKDGNDYVITGRKWFTSSADGARFAIVMAVTDPDAAKYGRASMIIVPTDTPGFNLVRNIPICGDAGAGWASHAELSYEGCRVPQSNRLGDEGSGFLIAQERLGPGRIHHCMRWMGICERAFDMMCERAATRMMAPGKPLGSKQIIQSWIAEARAKINAARLMVLQAAWKIDNEGFDAARVEVSLIKFYCADVLMEVVDRAIQVHGALGITSDTVLAYYYAHERGARIYDGPDEVHKVVVARLLMKQYETA